MAENGDAALASVVHDPMPERDPSKCVAMLDGRHWCTRPDACGGLHRCACGLDWSFGPNERLLRWMSEWTERQLNEVTPAGAALKGGN